ncbi:MAG TPA: alpha-galactosidase [Actinophytocola sp.]|uniref:alpha-galactosidase n=1 Tax=Actinophytocola sp. TaxID=1872138 RepID=UPI002DBEBD1C|nr:alpha-galactosidase [Actinophytocola sp.]HEU5470686.1 alpha-galactosidase [Actinophytocola sp.]
MIAFDEPTGTWVLSTPASSYALRRGEDGPRHVYWGPRLPPERIARLPVRARARDEIIGDELPGEGGERFGLAALRLAFADGTRAVDWVHSGHEIDGGHLVIRLSDRHHPVRLELHYRVHEDTDVLERWAVLRHTGTDEPVAVERFDAAAWTLPPRPDYRRSHVTGEWSAEFQLHRAPVAHGETTIVTRQGTARHQSNPWLMVDTGEATEEHGEVWSVALAWSGTWRITTRRTPGDDLVITAGAGHDGTVRRLDPGTEIRTPPCLGLYSRGGFGETSRRWHSFVRQHILPRPDEPRPVLYNSWEGTWFDVNEATVRELATAAASLGVELFVLDDGWFAGRTTDAAGLGDWWPDPDRFPHGLGPLIAEVHRLGMRFGLWVEPEMVNPDSDLYRAHPDWVLHMPHRPRTEIRNQLVLNFARPDVVTWAHTWLDRLLRDNAVDFLKWDMNRPFTEAGWPAGPDPQRLWFAHTEGVYTILDRLRADHPRLRMETCASGGGRVDLGILRRTDQAWTSDNTDPVDRIAIQHGFSQLYPALIMGSWASQSPNPLNNRPTPLRFRMHVAMAGVLGISGDLRTWSTVDIAEAATLIAQYKQIRPIVQHGHLYRLTPTDHDVTAVQYVTDDRAESVVLIWRRFSRPSRATRPLRLAGLDPAATYTTPDGSHHGGDVLLHHGIDPDLPPGDHASTLVRLRRSGS